MNCVLCKGTMHNGTTHFPIDRDSQFLLVKNVPALICEQCGEMFIDDKVYQKIEEIVNSVQNSNVEIEVLRFAA